MFVIKMLAEPGDIGRCSHLGRKCRNFRLNQSSSLKHFSRFFPRGFGNKSAAVGFKPRKAIMRQRLKSRSHDCTADRIDRCQLIFR
ncbi:hypothetical protein D9M70_594690 [compost metagenome]